MRVRVRVRVRRCASHAHIVTGELRPIATLLQEDQAFIKELQAEPGAEDGSGTSESSPARIRRDAVAKHADREQRLDILADNNTAIVSAAYFIVWTVFGMTGYPLGVAPAAVEMRLPALARAVPIAVGVVVSIAGKLQFTAWKAHHLACCRAAPERARSLPVDAGSAWRLCARWLS